MFYSNRGDLHGLGGVLKISAHAAETNPGNLGHHVSKEARSNSEFCSDYQRAQLHLWGMRKQASYPFVLNCAQSSSSGQDHFGSRREKYISLINRMEKFHMLWTNTKKAPETFSFCVISTSISNYCLKCYVCKHYTADFLLIVCSWCSNPIFPPGSHGVQ